MGSTFFVVAFALLGMAGHVVPLLTDRGMTVEGVDSTREVRALCEQTSLRLTVLDRVHEVLFDGAPAPSILDAMKG